MMAWIFGSVALVGCAAPSFGTGGASGSGALDGNDGSDDGVEVADRLFQGTLSGSDATSGEATFVIRPSGDVEALLANAKGQTRYVGTISGGRFSLTPASSSSTQGVTAEPAVCKVYPKQSGTYCTTSGSVLCGEGHCCPAERPYGCATNGSCYATSDAAAAACGTSCVACGSAPASGGSSSSGSSSSGSSGSSSESSAPVSGNVAGDTLSGNYPGGVFTAQDATKKPVVRYCGTFSGSDHGTWNWQANDTRASGSFKGAEAEGVLSGSVSGGLVKLTFDGDFVSGTATGSIGANSVSGTWKTSDGAYSGTWTGRAGACVGSSGSGSTSSSSGSSGSSGGGGCCTTVERNGKKMTACCIEGCRADGSCASGAGR